MDREEEIKEAQNRAYVEWFEKQQNFDREDDDSYKNPLPPYSRDPEFEKNHSEWLKRFPLDPVEPKAKTFILELFGTLVAVGLIMIFMFI
jgi:hypothetical protein